MAEPCCSSDLALLEIECLVRPQNRGSSCTAGTCEVLSEHALHAGVPPELQASSAQPGVPMNKAGGQRATGHPAAPAVRTALRLETAPAAPAARSPGAAPPTCRPARPSTAPPHLRAWQGHLPARHVHDMCRWMPFPLWHGSIQVEAGVSWDCVKQGIFICCPLAFAGDAYAEALCNLSLLS